MENNNLYNLKELNDQIGIKHLKNISLDGQMEIMKKIMKIDVINPNNICLGAEEALNTYVKIVKNSGLNNIKGFTSSEILGLYSGVNKNVQQLYCSVFGVSTKYDFTKLVEIIHQSIVEDKEEEDINIEDLAETMYDNSQDCIQKDQITKSVVGEDKKEKIKEIREWISLTLAFLSVLISIFSTIRTKQIQEENNIVNVNNYYVNELEIDADFLNMLSYRIINQNNVMPRTSSDCSSKVVAHLKKGQLVKVLDKYRKWIKISWEDENGQERTGWIQNYKVTEFR